jgi:hypothetical protein
VFAQPNQLVGAASDRPPPAPCTLRTLRQTNKELRYDRLGLEIPTKPRRREDSAVTFGE